jgi:hypothetical protein
MAAAALMVLAHIRILKNGGVPCRQCGASSDWKVKGVRHLLLRMTIKNIASKGDSRYHGIKSFKERRDADIMPSLDLPLTLLAGLLSLGGLAVLYLAWRRPGRSVPLRVLGWGLLAISVLPWAAAGGSGRGVALGLVVVSAAALILIGITGQWRGTAARRRRDTAAAEPAGATGWRHWGLVVLAAGPRAAAAAFALGLPFMQVSTWAEADRLIASAFAIIILWSAAAVWVCATPRLMRATATLAGLAAAGTVVLLVF